MFLHGRSSIAAGGHMHDSQASVEAHIYTSSHLSHTCTLHTYTAAHSEQSLLHAWPGARARQRRPGGVGPGCSSGGWPGGPGMVCALGSHRAALRDVHRERQHQRVQTVRGMWRLVHGRWRAEPGCDEGPSLRGWGAQRLGWRGAQRLGWRGPGRLSAVAWTLPPAVLPTCPTCIHEYAAALKACVGEHKNVWLEKGLHTD